MGSTPATSDLDYSAAAAAAAAVAASSSNASAAPSAAAAVVGGGSSSVSTASTLAGVNNSGSGSAQTRRASFRVKFSSLTLAFPEGAQSHPASVSFNFDSFWAATSTRTSTPAEAASTHHPLRFASTSTHSSKPRALAPPESEQAFVYDTSLASKLHRKFLVLTLHLPSGVTSPTAIISIDAIARGCQRIALTFPDPHDPEGTPVATAFFRVAMLNFDRVQAQLSDMKVADYPEKHIHDVKIMYVELGYKPFVEGYITRSEQSSEAEPRFLKVPQLERVCSLQEMLHGGATPSDLRIFFSLHRQVARTRSEEIGLGALPVHMLFSKVVNGYMEAPTKFKVPLAGYKGTVKGKILLRNIPQWSQLGGDDLLNRDGIISPNTVDLNQRKLLPWIRLPRSLSAKVSVPSPSVRPYSSPMAPAMQPSVPSVGSISENSEPSSIGLVNPPPSAKWLERNTSTIAGVQQPLSGAPGPALNMHNTAQMPQPVPGQGHSRHSSTGDHYPEIGSALYAADDQVPSMNPAVYSMYGGHVPTAIVGHLSAPTSPYYPEPFSDKEALERELQIQRQYQLQREEYAKQQYCSAQQQSQVRLCAPEPASVPPTSDIQSPQEMVGGGRSAKSLESSTTGHDGNSQSHSNNGSDDGLVAPDPGSSVHSTGNVCNGGASSLLGSVGAPAVPLQGDWIAIQDTQSDRYYYANRVTNESLWLPPLWEALQDGDGILFFVDHGNQTTQREFPAEQARDYKNSVFG